MNIRQATAADAELLTELRIKMRQERETCPLTVSEDEFFQANLKYFREALASGEYIGILVENDGIAVATGGICLHNHPPSYSVPNGKTACLLNMYTVPEFRGHGAASIIVNALLESARSCGCCKVTLNASSMGKPLYEKLGFTDISSEMEFVFSPVPDKA